MIRNLFAIAGCYFALLAATGHLPYNVSKNGDYFQTFKVQRNFHSFRISRWSRSKNSAAGVPSIWV